MTVDLPGTRKIYLDDKAERFCVVDEIDYDFLIKWKWHATRNSTGKKFYATRMSSSQSGGVRKQTKVYLHKVVLDRKGDKQPTESHTIGDHENGDSLDCRRENLSWATHSMNNKNRGGYHARQAALRV